MSNPHKARPLVAVVFALVALTLFAGPAAASTHLDSSGPVAARQLPSAALGPGLSGADSGMRPYGEVGTATTTPAPTFNQQVQNADSQTAKHKVEVGLTAVILLVIVYLGRRIRNRHKKKVKSS